MTSEKELAFVTLATAHAAVFVDLKAKGGSVSGRATKAGSEAYHLNACDPFVNRNLVLSCKAVHVSDQLAMTFNMCGGALRPVALMVFRVMSGPKLCVCDVVGDLPPGTPLELL